MLASSIPRDRRLPTARIALLLGASLFAAGCGEDPRLLLRLQTDLVAQADYGEARIVVAGESEGVEDQIIRRTREVTRDEGRDVRLGEVDPLPVGDYRIDVELWTDFGSRVAANSVLVQVRGPTVVTIPITADCAGLTCPGRGDGANDTFCLGGDCVPEACRDDRTAPGCPAAECNTDAECTSAVACAEPRCDEGVCVAAPNDELCAPTEICSARLGCVRRGDEAECSPGSCDDFNPCTDDVCGDLGCVFTPNTAGCDDGVFCNGADSCVAGSCSEHGEDPCTGIGTCEEPSRTCGGTSLCGADERVSRGACVACAPGTENGPGDDPSGPNTSCSAILCAADERVLANACFPCEAGSDNAPGDDASGPDTSCVVNACEVDRRVVANECVPCAAGQTNAAGDDPTGPNTACEAIVCAADFRVVSNTCVACPDGETNPAGDLADGADTTCMCVDSFRDDGGPPYAQWYARGNAFDVEGGRTLGNTDFYRQTLPTRVDEPVGGTTRGVLNDFLQNLYWREFSRPVEPEGLTFWTGQFEAGANFAQLRASVLEAGGDESSTRVESACGAPITNTCVQEGRNDETAPFARCIEGRIYARSLSGRGVAPGDASEYYAGTWASGMEARDGATYDDLNTFIDQVYETSFARPVDCEGLAFWAGQYVSNSDWDFSRLRDEILAAAGGELAACAEDTSVRCVDFTLDTCGGPL